VTVRFTKKVRKNYEDSSAAWMCSKYHKKTRRFLSDRLWENKGIILIAGLGPKLRLRSSFNIENKNRLLFRLE